MGGNVAAAINGIGENPAVDDLIGGIRIMLDKFESEEIDRLDLISNEFVNSMTQRPKIEQLLPLDALEDTSLQHRWDYLYEPEARDLIDGLVQRYMESQVYEAVIEYNNARQASITQEIAEIVGGAAALS